jgi:hypothetical protein
MFLCDTPQNLMPVLCQPRRLSVKDYSNPWPKMKFNFRVREAGGYFAATPATVVQIQPDRFVDRRKSKCRIAADSQICD